jgi:hypothetical protein
MSNSIEIFTAVFKDPISAENAYNLAIQKGYKADEINILMSEETKAKNYGSRLESNVTSLLSDVTADFATEKASLSSVIDTTAGAIIGATAAIGTNLVVPWIGFAIAGPIAAALAVAGAGGIAGGVIGALLNVGLSVSEADKYEEAIKEGGIIISIKPYSEDEAKELDYKWKAYGGTRFPKMDSKQ